MQLRSALWGLRMDERRQPGARTRGSILQGQPSCHGLDSPCIVCCAHGSLLAVRNEGLSRILRCRWEAWRVQCSAEQHKGALHVASEGFRKGYVDEHSCLGPDVLTRSLFTVGINRVNHRCIHRARIFKLVYPCLLVWSLCILSDGGVRGDMAGLGRPGPLQPLVLHCIQNLKVVGYKGSILASRSQWDRRQCA